MENRVRELALFNLGIDSKLRGCDLVSLKVRDVCHGDAVASLLCRQLGQLAFWNCIELLLWDVTRAVTGRAAGGGRHSAPSVC